MHKAISSETIAFTVLSVYANHLDPMSHPVRRQVYSAAVAAELDILFEHLLAEDLEFHLSLRDLHLVLHFLWLMECGFFYCGYGLVRCHFQSASQWEPNSSVDVSHFGIEDMAKFLLSYAGSVLRRGAENCTWEFKPSAVSRLGSP
jgi:hypothetical protein